METESTTNRPTPLMENTVSTMAEPASSEPNRSPMAVRIGIMAFLRVWEKTMTLEGMPRDREVRM